MHDYFGGTVVHMSDNQNGLWAAYVRAVAGDVSAQVIADRITERVGSGVSQPTVSRWLQGRYSGELKPGNVAAFAAAFDRPVLQAFVAAGLLNAADAMRGLTADELEFVVHLDPDKINPKRATRGRRTSPSAPRPQ